ncbi:hypothetical protein GJ689_24960 [Rhodoplanes serenus]|uniref:Uncharacterized protein n=1 Tax=Rhodoplanes serenus TaxID=200615 RepID=A0A9X4XS39_9BRAD|nr:hypothetical protein [Rhodoplanes serenus]MTW19446.1 hypothetical protein [Rhodoplanes serenus]
MKSIVKVKNSTRGRPPVDTEGMTVRVHRNVLDALEAYRREQDEIPSRPEAVRQIVIDWLVERGYLKPIDQTTGDQVERGATPKRRAG